MAEPGAILNRRLPRLLCFLTCCVISLCELIFGNYFLWVLWLRRYASGKVQVCLCWVPLMSDQFIRQFLHFSIVSTLWEHDANLDPTSMRGTSWILIFRR